MLRRAASAAALAVGVVLAGAAPATAVDPVTCPPPSYVNQVTGECTVVVNSPGGPGGAGGGGGEGHTGSTQPAKCVWAAKEIPCRNPEQGYWSNDLLCYVSPSHKNYPPGDAIWKGHYPEGAIYLCYNPYLPGGMKGYDFWSAAAPAGPAAPPDPRALAQKAVASMRLRAITVGIVPESRPGSIGLVGMPNWMWVQNRSQNTWGPITRSASAAGWTVTATARVSRVTWDMGDGQVITCGAGTPYQDSDGKRQSPDCGHTYTRQGVYTVRATSHWVIDWSGIGQTGSIAMDLTQSAPVTIGEAQVLAQ